MPNNTVAGLANTEKGVATGQKSVGNAPAFDGRAFLRTVTTRPGVYRILDAAEQALYVGKAANLRNRLRSYCGGGNQALKIRRIMAQAHSIKVTVTASEREALVLESSLIKNLRPRYNVLFRDDKSYPYLRLDDSHDFPRLHFYRGSRRERGRYFGPYPDPRAVRGTLSLLQKLFRIRDCDDRSFRGRRRPCLQYQLQRCTAPCVGYIGREEYLQDVHRSALLLEGRDRELMEGLLEPMRQAAERLDFERAARYRDQVAKLRAVQARHRPSDPGAVLDAIACRIEADRACVQVFPVRGGTPRSSRAFFPSRQAGAGPGEVLSAFLSQYYLADGGGAPLPAEILLNHLPDDCRLLESVLAERAGRPVTIRCRPRGERGRWLSLAGENARLALAEREAARGEGGPLRELGRLLERRKPLCRIEGFDISHTRGEAATASCVVFDAGGARRGEYRRFNIRGIRPGDDCAAIGQAVTRHYRRRAQEAAPLPDLLLIDGGRAQAAQAVRTLRELQLASEIEVLGIRKGEGRRPSEDRLVRADGRCLRLAAASPALRLLQRVRDEAHRFASAGHRRRRARQRLDSPLTDLPGIGQVRRRSLLLHFGGAQGVRAAGTEELARVPGIGKRLARHIHGLLHEDP